MPLVGFDYYGINYIIEILLFFLMIHECSTQWQVYNYPKEISFLLSVHLQHLPMHVGVINFLNSQMSSLNVFILII